LVQRDEMSLARPDDLRDRRRYPATICPSHFPVSGNGLCIRRRNPSLISRSLVCMRSRGGGNARHLTCSHVSTPHDPRRPPREVRFALDSPVEEGGFELVVPL
jgi:hypothetical protein